MSEVDFSPNKRIRVPATRTGQMYDVDAKRWTPFNACDAYGAMGVLIDHPSLTDAEKGALSMWASENLGNGHSRDEFTLRQSGSGFFDLIRYGRLNDRERGRSDTPVEKTSTEILLESAIEKIHKGTDIFVLNKEDFANPGKVPLELQYALGLGGSDLTKRLKKSLEFGDKVVFMKVKELPEKLHETLHTLKHITGGASNVIVDSIENDEPINTEKMSEKDRKDVAEAEESIKEGSRKLLHFSILSKRPSSDEIRDLEKDINGLLDNNVDIPYAMWRYALDMVGGDVRLASCFLAFSGGVAALLQLAGMGNTGNNIIEGLKLSASPAAAEFATLAAAATPLVSGNLKGLAKIKELTRIIFTKKEYLTALGVGLVLDPILGIEASNFLAHGQNFLAGITLGLSAPLPTWLAVKATEMNLARVNSGPDSAKKEMQEHPVERALLPGSTISGVLTAVFGALGKLSDPMYVNFSTQMVEQISSILIASSMLWKQRQTYRDTISKNPRVAFIRAMAK